MGTPVLPGKMVPLRQKLPTAFRFSRTRPQGPPRSRVFIAEAVP